MPRGQELLPPLKIPVKLSIEADGKVTFKETTQKVDRAPEERATWPDNPGSMMKRATQRLQLMS